MIDPTAFIHPTAIVESGASIGARTRVWAYTHILSGAAIGSDCNVCDHVFIEGNVNVGDRVTIKSGVQLWDGTRLADDVFIGPNVTFTNDRFPRSRQRPAEYPQLQVLRGASIGANATLLPGLSIGTAAMVGAGAVVTRNVPPHATVAGNPARIIGYATDSSVKSAGQGTGELQALPVAGAKLCRLPVIRDLRGSLLAAEYGKDIPFTPQRVFTIFDVPSKEIRGEHAHKELHQVLACVRGNCSVMLDNGKNTADVLLNSPDLGLYIGPMIWATQYNYSADAVLLVLASAGYDPDDYIRDYSDFIKTIRA